MRNSDDTVIMRRALPRRMTARTLAPAIVLLVLAFGGGSYFALRPTGPPPPPPISSADEATMRATSPTTRTVLRFAPNPAILVLDFPTLAEQGRMLNRIAAWAEKANVPHDRLLTDAELAAAIAATGDTADTYYYGHDYSGADVARFFALADRDHIPLGAEEKQLRQLMHRALAEPAGFGALITMVRADEANAVDPAARATILHHELSHGEFFTRPAYAKFVHTFWSSTLTEAERTAFRAYLAHDGYDPALEEVIVNETQAYLMFTPDPRYFDAAQLGLTPARLAEIRQTFLAGMPPGWLRDAALAPWPTPTPRAPLPRRAAPSRRRYFSRVSSRTAVAETWPPLRRTSSIAARNAAV